MSSNRAQWLILSGEGSICEESAMWKRLYYPRLCVSNIRGYCNM